MNTSARQLPNKSGNSKNTVSYKLKLDKSKHLNTAVLQYQWARSKRVNASLKPLHMKPVPNAETEEGRREVWGSGAAEKKIPRSALCGKLVKGVRSEVVQTDVKSDKRQA